jgi:sugar lactone lactonase YvrE
LGRSASLLPVTPGQTELFYVAHENNKTTVSLDVNADGTLANPTTVYQHGQYSSVLDKNGNLYIADGEIFVYDKSGKEVKRIRLEERPISLTIGGRNLNILFATTSKSLYSINL